METMNVTGEVLQQLSYLSDNEDYMKKALKSLRKLVVKKQTATAAAAVDDDDEEYISKEEILAGIRQGLLEMKEARRTGEKMQDARDLVYELRD